MAWVDVCPLEALPPGQKTSVVVVNHEGALFALHNDCPHRGGPLGMGDLLGTELYCPLHAWPFDIRTGVCTLFPEAKVRVFDVRVEAGRIQVAEGGRFT